MANNRRIKQLTNSISDTCITESSDHNEDLTIQTKNTEHLTD